MPENVTANSIATEIGYIVVTVVVAMVIQYGVRSVVGQGRKLIHR